MKSFILLITLTFTTIGFSQTENDCERLLSQKIQSDSGLDQSIEDLISTFSKFKNCGLEQIEIDFFIQGPILGTLIIGLTNDSKGEITYQQLYDYVLKLKEAPDYQDTIKLFKISKELLERKPNIKNWETDKPLFEKLGLPEETIENIRLMVISTLETDKTYAELLANQEKKNEFSKPKKIIEHNVYESIGNVNYDDLLKKSIELKKPLLLYFTGYACINCRKIEQNILYDSRIQDQLKNDFYFVNLYVDDKKKLPETELTTSKISGKPIKYIGQKHSELQMTKFNTNTQPYFVIINNEGEKVSNTGYITDTEIFIEFLKSVN